jgi:hypothetical protein
VLEKRLSNVTVVKFQRFETVFPEVNNKLFFQKIGAGRFCQDLFIEIVSEKHFITMKSGNLMRAILDTDLFNTWHTVSI